MADDLIRLGSGMACAFVALLFLRAALHKAGDLERFEGVLADYDLVPDGTLRAMARIIPGLEIACAAALALEPTRTVGASAAGLLLLGYGAAMGINLARGRAEIDCGCGGTPEPLSWLLVGRNLILAAAVLPAGLAAVAAPSTWGQTGVCWAMAAIAFGCWGAIEQLLANAGRMDAGDPRKQMPIFGGAQ